MKINILLKHIALNVEEQTSICSNVLSYLLGLSNKQVTLAVGALGSQGKDWNTMFHPLYGQEEYASNWRHSMFVPTMAQQQGKARCM